jgi:hypothetical protein
MPLVRMGMAEEFTLTQDDRGRLTLKRPGMPDVADVRPRRAFPWTHTDGYISLRNAEGKEVLLIESLKDLPRETRQIIEQSLNSTTFIPKITRVDSVDVSFGHQQWSTQTDRGPISFRVQEREDIRFLPDGRFLLKDADGNQYELARLDQLDDRSRRAVEPLL